MKERLAPYKYPRLIEFVAELPKTATGKIQRFKLRERDAGSLPRSSGPVRGSGPPAITSAFTTHQWRHDMNVLRIDLALAPSPGAAPGHAQAAGQGSRSA